MTYNSATEWPDDPHKLFDEWLAEAEKAEPNDPNAMCLATVDANQRPSNRMVLLKGHDERGFVFYTNSESKKGSQLDQNMNAALCFYWKSSRKQVRIEGAVELVSKDEADAYFASRHRGSRIGAWASSQSRPLSHRDEFENKITHFETKYEGEEDIPRAPYWNGYRVIPSNIEFWINETHRLHRRCVYTKTENGWNKEMLYP